MNNQSRIPQLQSSTFDGALFWFSELQTKGLLFHPEDDPAEIVHISDGSRFFTDTEIIELRVRLNQLEVDLGHNAVIEAAYPIFMNAFGLRLDA